MIEPFGVGFVLIFRIHVEHDGKFNELWVVLHWFKSIFGGYSGDKNSRIEYFDFNGCQYFMMVGILASSDCVAVANLISLKYVTRTITLLIFTTSIPRIIFLWRDRLYSVIEFILPILA